MIGRVVIAPYELPIELIVGILGSLIFVVLLLYRLRHGRKAIRLTGGGAGCGQLWRPIWMQRRRMNRTSTALPSASYRANVRKVTLLALLVLLAAVCYMVVAVNFGSQQLMLYSMKIRTKLVEVILITAFAIGGASIVFQSIINNTIVTPCLLGMNSLYTLIHTAVVFFAGSGSLLARSANLSLRGGCDPDGHCGLIIHSHLFSKTNHTVYSICPAHRHRALLPFSPASRPR